MQYNSSLNIPVLVFIQKDIAETFFNIGEILFYTQLHSFIIFTQLASLDFRKYPQVISKQYANFWYKIDKTIVWRL